MTSLILKPGKEKSLWRHHPWIFAGAVERVDGRVRVGDTVTVMSAEGQALGRAAFSPESSIRARMWSFDPAETVDDAFFKRKVAQAVARREALPELRGQDGLRLVHGEADGLPGVVADRYGDTVVLQLGSAGADKWRRAIANALAQVTGCARIFERSDMDVRALEGLPPATGPLLGEAPEEPLTIVENGVQYLVDVVQGHKTGFYLDQRENRRYLGELSEGRDVLNCFCYTGGFSLQALKGGAKSVLSLDSSAEALALAKKNAALNGWADDGRAEWREADVFSALRTLREEGRSFDLVVLDPPKFAPTAGHAEKAARAYKDIALNGLKLLRPGGLLFTYSCSGGIPMDLFRKITAGAAWDAGVEVRLLRQLSAGPDHPVSLNFPEGEYLKGLVGQV
ncbi:MAG: class I SAM-dependent rRNA methyltransferase [Rhodocyclaceae bacterium]|nr:class I SAM-dependent rRNA methyltransferase [Rhodocyclaceae bacterium]